MKQWKRREEGSTGEPSNLRKTGEASEEMEVMIIEAAAARADRVGKKDENHIDFTCEDYGTEMQITD
eukprot:4601789-Heterocapsa_arctica.AAC.1